jgi:hypothetical protein
MYEDPSNDDVDEEEEDWEPGDDANGTTDPRGIVCRRPIIRNHEIAPKVHSTTLLRM